MGDKTRFYVDIMAFHPEVTGSCNLIVVKYPDGTTNKFIVDCGLFQEREYSAYNKTIMFDPETIDFVLITHNHIDHTGRLPLLVARNYNGKIYMTESTTNLIRLALSDSYKVLKNVAKRENEKPLYNDDDVQRALQKVVGCKFEEPLQINPNIKVTFFSNGHLLGAALILVQISYPGYEDINLLFTGDYNDKNLFFDVKPLPDEVKKLPLTIIQESTYGDMDSTELTYCYEDNIVKAIAEGKTVVTPVFSLGRAQEILYVLKTLQDSGKLSKSIPIYFDGKLAIQYTKLYLSGKFDLKKEMVDFEPTNLVYVDEPELRAHVVTGFETKIIVTTSGMGSYGPAQTYIPEYLSRKNALIQFTGYTAEGTLGQRLKTTPKGEPVDVAGLVVIKRADVEYTTEYSAHAKADEMIKFLKQFENTKLVLINHGEINVKETFAKRVLKEVESKHVGILGRDYFFRISPYGLVKSMGTKYN